MGRWIDAEGDETEGPPGSAGEPPSTTSWSPSPQCGEESRRYSCGFFGVVAAPPMAPMAAPAAVAPVLPPMT